MYLITTPLRAVSGVLCAGALASAVDYANGGDLAHVWGYLIAFAGYILFDLAIDALDQWVRLHLAKRTLVALRTDAYHKLAHMCYLHFFQHNSADYLSNMTTDVEILRDSYFNVLLGLWGDFSICIVAFIVLLWISPVLGGFVLLASLLQALVPILYSKKLERAGAEHSDAQERHMQILKENLDAFLTAKNFHIEDKLETNYTAAMTNAEERRRRMRFLKEWTSSLSYVFNQSTLLGVYLLGAVLSIRGIITIAEVVAASQLITYISNPVLWLTGDLNSLRTAKIPAKKLRAILDEPEDLGGPENLLNPSGQLSVQGLHFFYGQREILSGISFDFYPGKKYLIVGTSGSGKSTFLNLIAGLRDDYTGSIVLGGTELRHLSRASLTKSICCITQEPFLFDATIYENVCLYENMEEETVRQALMRVGLGVFLEGLPLGIHTPLGESGATMSGGEKQRLVIARAIVRKNPILLLDESTSHLDPVTAAGIERLVLGLQDVTVLLVSHNATEAGKAGFDKVLEMRGGRLVHIPS